ncbi:hypothetical protein Sjap_014736 [Stephania japonica]|uniref:Uncharacterized protein n=1 Tax=Stephania japonica TaxID=461633 RepID=A0AAP0IHV6_9MAGN
MSVSCGVECVVCITCSRWAWKRCTHIGSTDSATWPPAASADFSPIPRVCRLILAVYESDLEHPKFPPPPSGFRPNPSHLVKRVTYDQTLGRSPPYIVYLDHDHKEIVLAIRGLNLAKESDYQLLLDNKLGMQKFDGGYVHRGLLKSATWVLEEESPTLRRLWRESGGEYSIVFAGHSLGSGVAALLAVVVVNHREELGGVPRSKLRCYALAPARCMSLNLAVKYADVISSVVLQEASRSEETLCSRADLSYCRKKTLQLRLSTLCSAANSPLFLFNRLSLLFAPSISSPTVELTLLSLLSALRSLGLEVPLLANVMKVRACDFASHKVID